MPSIVDLFSKFFRSDVLPFIVAETLRLNQEGKNANDIVKEIMASVEREDAKLPRKTPLASVTPRQTTEGKVRSWVPIEKYISDYQTRDVCHYVNSKGEDKDKICCQELPSGYDLSEDRDKYRCNMHKRGPSKRTVSSVLKDYHDEKKKSSSATANSAHLEKIKSLTDVSSSVEKKPSLLSTLNTFTKRGENILDRIKKHEEKKTKTEDEPENKTSYPAALSDDDAEAVPSVGSASRAVSEESHKSEETVARTKKSSKEETPQFEEKEVMAEISTDLPSANKYSWMQFSSSQFLVLEEKEENYVCYGMLKISRPHDPNEKLSVPTAWKDLLQTPCKDALDYLEKNKIAIEKF
jgi:hypothetical protein